MKTFGETVRRLREEKDGSLRTVAACLGIDQAILSKAERDQRRLTREQVIKLAKYFKVNKDELLLAWLADKLVDEVEDEDLALKALQVAEAKIEYAKSPFTGGKSIINSLRSFIEQDGRIKKAWLFGSFARGEETLKSDIDLMVSFSDNKKISLFDLADIAYQMGQRAKRKIDLVEEGCLEDFALRAAQNDFIKIYG